MGFFSVLSAAVSIGTSLYGISQSNKASKASQRADEERRQAAKVQERINERKFMKERLQQVARGRKERASILSRQVATGSSGGSSRGAVGHVQTQTASNVAFQQSIFDLGQQISGYSQQASIFASSANYALAKGERVKGYGEIGSSIFKALD